MALDIDSRLPRRNYAALKELVIAVRDCSDPGAEHHAIEWKTEIDLSTKAGQFAVSRAILGLANRTVEGAGRHFGGLGYVLIGIEPGNAVGTSNWDGQVLEPLLSAYLGADGPVWHHDNVDIDGKNIVVVTVEGPTEGDHIHTLRRAWSADDGKKAAEEGAIFVRRSAATHRANTAEVRSLELRLRPTGQARLDLVLGVREGDALRAIRLADGESELESMIHRERESVIGKPPRPQPSNLLGTMSTGIGESDFLGKVDTYIAHWSTVARDLFRDRIMQMAKDHRQVLTVKNPGDEAVEGVRVEAWFPSPLEVYFEDIEPKVPRRPKRSSFPESMLGVTPYEFDIPRFNFGRLATLRSWRLRRERP